MASPKIVRKVSDLGHTVAMWLGEDRRVRGWGELDDFEPADQVIARSGINGGWLMNEETAAQCDTTLAALRAELEGGEDE